MAVSEQEARLQMHNALFLMQENMRDVVAGLEGTVRDLVGHGWTDDQARAIVAAQFGWRPADPTTSTGNQEN